MIILTLTHFLCVIPQTGRSAFKYPPSGFVRIPVIGPAGQIESVVGYLLIGNMILLRNM